MNNYVQLYSFLFSFGFGVLFAFLNEINTKLISRSPNIFKIVITFLFVLDVSLLYLVTIYFINNGILHLYFFIFIFLGYIFSVKKIKLLTSCIVSKIRIVMKKRKCYDDNIGGRHEKESIKKS